MVAVILEQVNRYLDANKYDWDYEVDVFPVNYIYNGVEKQGTYRPDFKIKSSNEYWEVKGYWRDDAKDKYDAFIEQHNGIKIKLIQKEDMISLGLSLRRGAAGF